ncbi:unnamed protein product [Brachionus calyciflorus]|uniref:Protein LTV1 homolog n=1 Tax=Brachionus calyciflorus TaxID=104777 RepID=A0A814CWI9_9BILA|nr:unnamed protein product [Brachionus calyciflorus]
MGGKSKPFIKKGEGVKFHLVHRSQKDPLYLDENLGEHVLVPADPDYVNNDLANTLNGMSLKKNNKKTPDDARFSRIEEQHKFGVYYDDDYDYLQHLREVDQIDRAEMEQEKKETIKIGSVLIKTNEYNDDPVPEKPKIQLPSSVFGSKVEEEIGYFNQAAPDHDPKIDWDPEIVKILDEDDVEYSDDIDDDFFLKANADDDNEEEDDDDEEEEDEDVEYDSDDLYEESESVKDFETKSRFSNYSMTSSVIRRNAGLSQLDEQFEKFFAQYDEDQIGALDTEDIDGFRMNDQVLESALEDFKKYIEKNKYQPEKSSIKPNLGVLMEENSDAETVEESGEEDSQDENNNYDTVHYYKKKEKEERFDCESIISTYSTLYNHPSVISEKSDKIQLSKKSGLPLGVFTEKAKTQKEMDRIDHRITRILPEIQPRSKDETKEEKKARKQAVKEHRRERRVEKKINKLAFKDEQKSQASQIKAAMDNSNIVKLP